jgi:hypothetical protein
MKKKWRGCYGTKTRNENNPHHHKEERNPGLNWFEENPGGSFGVAIALWKGPDHPRSFVHGLTTSNRIGVNIAACWFLASCCSSGQAFTVLNALAVAGGGATLFFARKACKVS